MVSNALDYIPNIRTTESGRKALYELKQDILEAFEEETNDKSN